MFCYQRRFQAGEAISEYQVVYIDGADSEHIKKATGNTLLGSGVFGIAQDDIADDAMGAVILLGPTKVILEGAVELGDLLQCSATAGALEKLAAGGIPVGWLNTPLKKGASGGTNTDTVDAQKAEVFFFGGIPQAARPLRGTKTHDFGTIADEAEASTTITVAGAVVGDMVQVVAPELDAGLTIHAYVSAANTVTVKVGCFAAAGVDTTELNLIVLVTPQSTVGA